MYRLNNGNYIPKIGFGTYLATENDCYNAVKIALDTGYRHIDTASYYNNEIEVGRAIKESNVDRKDIFITTKIWNTVLTYQDAIKSVDESLKKLNLEYIDLCLIHWPNPIHCRDNWQQRNKEVYRAMEECVKLGKIKNIGVSNFLVHHLEKLFETAKIKPVVNQIKMSVGINQDEVVDFCNKHNILIEAWAPLGRATILENQYLLEIAKKYKKTPAQICLAYCLNKGYLPLPKSVNETRIRQNFDCTDIQLTKEEMEILKNIQGVLPPKDPDNIDY